MDSISVNIETGQQYYMDMDGISDYENKYRKTNGFREFFLRTVLKMNC